MRSYAISVSIPGGESRLEDLPTREQAFAIALAHVRTGDTVTLLEVTGDAELYFAPLCVISPVPA